MMIDRSKQHARLGLFYLKEAVLEFLLDQTEPLKTEHIKNGFGLPPETAGEPEHLIKGILHHLYNDGHVERVKSKRNTPIKWKLTDGGKRALKTSR